MREATLFQVTALSVLVRDTAKMFQLHEFDNTNVVFGGRTLQCRDEKEAMQIRHLPIHHLVTLQPDGSDKDQLIILSPKLQELLEAPFRCQITSLTAHLDVAASRAFTYAQKLEANQKILGDFLALPWYRRVWCAVRGGM